MLYPLSYEGARAQSSDLGFTWAGREWPTFTHVIRTAVLPAQDHTRAPEPRVTNGGRPQ